jgi:hypothetical protein
LVFRFIIRKGYVPFTLYLRRSPEKVTIKVKEFSAVELDDPDGKRPRPDTPSIDSGGASRHNKREARLEGWFGGGIHLPPPESWVPGPERIKTYGKHARSCR